MSPPVWTHTSSPQRICFGVGSTNRLGVLLRELGLRRILLVTTPARLATEQGSIVQRQLARAVTVTFDGARPHVPAAVVQAAIVAARGGDIDGVVSFGGGAVVDLAKAVANFTEAEQGAPGVAFTDRPLLPHIAIVTTHVGAAYTPGFAITDERSGVTTSGGSSTGTPVAVIVDPLAAMPVASVAGAVAGGVEAAWATDRSAEAEVVALAGLRLLAEATDDTDRAAAAVLCGRAMANSGMGAVHGLAQLLGGRAGVTHADACRALLPVVMKANAEVIPELVAEVSAALGGLLGRLPGGPGPLEVAASDLDAVARLSQGNRAVQRNPRPLDEDAVRSMLAAVS